MNVARTFLYISIIALWPGAVVNNQMSGFQTSIIPITDTASSNGAFVRGASNDGKRIVFESTNDYTGENKDLNNEIFVYDSELRRIIQLTKTGGESTSGSSGGSRLSSRKCPGSCETGQASAINAVPAISGDGTRIVFASTSGTVTDTANVDGNGEIYLAKLPRGNVSPTIERITETDGAKDSFDNNTPSINYDGSVIAFVSTRKLFKSRGVVIFSAQNEDSNAQIHVYNAASQSFTQVTNKRIDEGMDGFEVKGFISNPTLSGDGKTLAFLSGFNFNGQNSPNNADLNGEIFIHKIGDPINQVTQVTSTSEQAEVPEDGAVNVLSRFSKHLSDDGSLLVFESAGGARPVKTGERIRDVFIYQVKSGEFTQVTTQDAGQRDLSDFNYFPAINGAGTYLTFSSKLNLPVINDSAGNFDNSREIYRYDIKGSTASAPQFFLATQMSLSTDPGDQRQIILAPFVSDDGASIAFSNNGNLIAEKFNITAEVFEARLRPVVRDSGAEAALANDASLDRTYVARGSIVAAAGSGLSPGNSESNDYDNYPFELNGVSVTIGDSLSGVAARIISVAPDRIRFVFPTGIAADDDLSCIINNNGTISTGTVDVRDASPGIYALSSDGKGAARARCSRISDDGAETDYSDMPCAIGDDSEFNSLIFYGTGFRFGTDITVRFRFKIENGEEDEIELVPSYAGSYIDENGVEHLGLDQISVTLDEDLAGKIDVETAVLLTSNSESVASQAEVTTSFSTFEEDMAVINAASQESGPVARGSIALALTQNDDDEEDIFSEENIAAPPTAPPFELNGIRVKVAGVDARILEVSPDLVKFIVPSSIQSSDQALFQITNSRKRFNARAAVKDAAPGLFTQSNEGTGAVAAKCALVLSNGSIELTSPPCAVSSDAEKRILILTGTGWRFASSVKLTFDNIELTPTYAGPEPGLPGVDRIEVVLPNDLAGREDDILVNASINSEPANSRSGATIGFQELSESRILNLKRSGLRNGVRRIIE